jgi:RimJ/RimL family protein N-acetyltransferase
LGYTIDAIYRGKGYAKESALAMMEWSNERKVDEIDGLEYVYIANLREEHRSDAESGLQEKPD